MPPLLVHIVLLGVGATVVMDLWVLLLARLTRVPPLDYGLVGRWLGHIPSGRLAHPAIAAAAPVPGEKAVGWLAHYLIGVSFAALPPLIWGPAWLADPSPGPALIVGLATVAAPFLILQPALGAGVAASRTPHPGRARLRSVITHLVFGGGLYLSAVVLAHLTP